MILPLNQVIVGDCAEVMREWPDNSVDTIVTDPPYGISFMGKEWDQALPPRAAFEQMIRVLKPGALAFVMSSPRQDVLWRMLAMLEGVGFELRQSFISWIYKTGFPKAYDVSKGIDKKIGQVNQSIIDIKKKLIELYDGSGKTRNQIDKECGFRACNYLSLPKEGKRPDPWIHILPTLDKWLIIKKVIEYIPSDLNEIFIEAEREVIGIGYNEGDPSNWYKFKKRDPTYITAPGSSLSTKWDGWKSITGLKPALECILMVNKPRSEPTIVDNVLRWGTGAMNVDACRIPFKQDDNIHAKNPHTIRKTENYEFRSRNFNEGAIPEESKYDIPKGRFPANLLISDGALDTGETTKSTGGITKGKLGNRIYGRFENIDPQAGEGGYGDEGSPFRFFDLDAWAEHHGFLDVAKPSRAERDMGLWTQPLQVPKSKFNLNDGSKDMRFNGVIPTPRRNTHPTCKPVKLMAYLIELGCPPKGIVVDPFLGSGTTCIAAKRLRRKWIGIEINPEYAEIAEARINIRGPLDQFMEAESNG